jgi:hypothetical protein
VRSDSRDRWVVGIDDTDMPAEGGTGQLARSLARVIEQLGMGASVGVTRHQLFEGPGVPKTSRNSAAAVEFVGLTSAAALLDAVAEHVAGASIPGSDPGVALAPLRLEAQVTAFARSAQSGLVTAEQARRVAAGNGVVLEGLGGDHGGVIGALAAVGLRSTGNDGRFVGLAGIRNVAGVMQVADVLEQTGIALVLNEAGGEPLPIDAAVDLRDWVRPRLMQGLPVLVAQHDGGRWTNADARPG